MRLISGAKDDSVFSKRETPERKKEKDMKNQVTTSPATQSPAQTETKAMEANNMKKIIVTVAIAFVIALSALIINPSVAAAQSPQANQALISSFNHITTHGNDDWDGGFTTQGNEDWDGGFTTQGNEDWDGGFVKTSQNNNWFY